MFLSATPAGLQFIAPGRLVVALSFPAQRACAMTSDPSTQAEATPVDSPEPSSTPSAAQDVDSSLKTFALANDSGPDVRFEGRVLASSLRASRSLRSMLLSVMETKGGKIVAVRTGLSLVPGERNRQDVYVLDDLSGLPAVFGHDAQAKQLYSQLSLTVVQDIP